MKILINVPDIKHINGGVTNHYRGLMPYWTENVHYNYIGKRREGGNGKYWLLYDIIKFVFRILLWRPDVILLNPSLNKSAVIRDSIFFKIAIVLRVKVSVMFHGWSYDYAEKINKEKFCCLFNHAKCIFVLARDFKEQLLSWGINIPIILTTTKVDDRMILDYDVKKRFGDVTNFLFLGRIVVEKGIYETLDTFRKIVATYPNSRLKVVGDGSDFEYMNEYVKAHKIPNVDIAGNLNGRKLIDAFKESDFYIFPTAHAEGMPTSLLEAMAFGLPVLTRPVGGIKDFFENGKMGIITESKDPDEYYKFICDMISNKQKVLEISRYNHQYAIDHFLASSVARRMENTLRKYF